MDDSAKRIARNALHSTNMEEQRQIFVDNLHQGDPLVAEAANWAPRVRPHAKRPTSGALTYYSRPDCVAFTRVPAFLVP